MRAAGTTDRLGYIMLRSTGWVQVTAKPQYCHAHVRRSLITAQQGWMNSPILYWWPGAQAGAAGRRRTADSGGMAAEGRRCGFTRTRSFACCALPRKVITSAHSVRDIVADTCPVDKSVRRRMHDHRGRGQSRCLNTHDADAAIHAYACKRLLAKASDMAPVPKKCNHAASACVYMLMSRTERQTNSFVRSLQLQ